MATDASPIRKRRALWRTRNGTLLALALLSSAVAWWMIAWPVFTLSNIPAHRGHFALTFAHMVGGTGMLWLGGLNLHLAARKDHYALHRRVGQAYLFFGTCGAGIAMIVTSTSAHKSAGSLILTNTTVSLLTLATAWLCQFARWYCNGTKGLAKALVVGWLRPVCIIRPLENRADR